MRRIVFIIKFKSLVNVENIKFCFDVYMKSLLNMNRKISWVLIKCVNEVDYFLKKFSI